MISCVRWVSFPSMISSLFSNSAILSIGKRLIRPRKFEEIFGQAESCSYPCKKAIKQAKRLDPVQNREQNAFHTVMPISCQDGRTLRLVV